MPIDPETLKGVVARGATAKVKGTTWSSQPWPLDWAKYEDDWLHIFQIGDEAREHLWEVSSVEVDEDFTFTFTCLPDWTITIEPIFESFHEAILAEWVAWQKTCPAVMKRAYPEGGYRYAGL